MNKEKTKSTEQQSEMSERDEDRNQLRKEWYDDIKPIEFEDLIKNKLLKRL